MSSAAASATAVPPSATLAIPALTAAHFVTPLERIEAAVRAAIVRDLDEQTPLFGLIAEYAYEPPYERMTMRLRRSINIFHSVSRREVSGDRSAGISIANVELYSGSGYFSTLSKRGPHAEKRWGKDEKEPFVHVRIHSEESIARCEAEHRPRCKNTGFQGTWHDAPPEGLENVPCTLPLRLFWNRVKQVWKEQGDEVRIQLKDRCVSLIIRYDNESQRIGLGDQVETYTTFSHGIDRRIEASLACQIVTIADIEAAKAAAPMPHEWVSSE